MQEQQGLNGSSSHPRRHSRSGIRHVLERIANLRHCLSTVPVRHDSHGVTLTEELRHTQAEIVAGVTGDVWIAGNVIEEVAIGICLIC